MKSYDEGIKLQLNLVDKNKIAVQMNSRKKKGLMPFCKCKIHINGISTYFAGQILETISIYLVLSSKPKRDERMFA